MDGAQNCPARGDSNRNQSGGGLILKTARRKIRVHPHKMFPLCFAEKAATFPSCSG
jgi:hypothetical protein